MSVHAFHPKSFDEFEEFGRVLLVPEAIAERASNKDIAP